MAPRDTPAEIALLLAPGFNVGATMAFIDPFRAANYLDGAQRFRWGFYSVAGGPCEASNGAHVDTADLGDAPKIPLQAVVSTSWTPERHAPPPLLAVLRRWAAAGTLMGGIDTGAFVLAAAGLLEGRRATVHYEHIDAMGELYPDVQVTETLCTFDAGRFTCAGGLAAADCALRLLAEHTTPALANRAARYLFHPGLRPDDASQNPGAAEPFGATVPEILRTAVRMMEEHLEDPLQIPDLARLLGVSQRQLNRLFSRYTRKSPVAYYRDIRLDRARGLVTQTDLPMSEVAIASGFGTQVHFSRAYRAQFGLSPSEDRVEGRIPFEFRAWPMHRGTKKNKQASKITKP